MVQIRDDDGLDEMATDLRNMLINYREAFHHATSSWNEQIMDALNPEGGVGQDGEELDLTFMDYFMHYLSIFWKLLFCIVPPTAYCGGWVTFFCSLVFIGALTTVVGEFASLFGCSIGLKDSITALSFVALGTSLPDTFASKIAAEEVGRI